MPLLDTRAVAAITCGGITVRRAEATRSAREPQRCGGMQKLTSFLFASMLAACATHGDASTTSALSGNATYRDATTDTSGQPQKAASPPAQQMTFTLEVDGHGTIPTVDPRCATDPSGAFVANYAGTAQLASDGTYTTGTLASTGAIATPSGCAIQNLTASAVTGAKLHAELAVNTQNCQTYCAASARADAEAQCAQSPDAVSCRSNAESSLAASCQTTCTTKAHAITADAELGADAFGGLDAMQLQGAELGDLQASLVFSAMTDASGGKL